MLSHANWLAALSTSAVNDITSVKTDVHLSYLPLAHIYERLIEVNLIYVGAKIFFYSGDILKLGADIALVRPTIFASVPRLFSRFYDGIMQMINFTYKPLKKYLAHAAIK